MTPEQIELERQAFEAWYCFGNPNDECFAKNKIGSYSNPMTVIAFNVWLARAQQSAWINVNDRLPQLREDVLVAWSNGEIGFARRYNHPQNSGECWDTTASNATITYWQPLPKPPKAA